jgi:hypothetical protein
MLLLLHAFAFHQRKEQCLKILGAKRLSVKILKTIESRAVKQAAGIGKKKRCEFFARVLPPVSQIPRRQ